MTVNGLKNINMNKKNIENKYKILKERLVKKSKEHNQLLIEIDRLESTYQSDISSLEIKNNKYKKFAFAMLFFFFVFTLVNFSIYNSFNRSKASQEELMIKELAKKINFADEEPTILKVKNIEKLNTNPAFANVNLGDTVLIYNNAKLMLIYSNYLQKIVSIQDIDFEI